jgi:hypothetical protein
MGDAQILTWAIQLGWDMSEDSKNNDMGMSGMEMEQHARTYIDQFVTTYRKNLNSSIKKEKGNLCVDAPFYGLQCEEFI